MCILVCVCVFVCILGVDYCDTLFIIRHLREWWGFLSVCLFVCVCVGVCVVCWGLVVLIDWTIWKGKLTNCDWIIIYFYSILWETVNKMTLEMWQTKIIRVNQLIINTHFKTMGRLYIQKLIHMFYLHTHTMVQLYNKYSTPRMSL